jgi:type I restriction enzyme, S subunit
MMGGFEISAELNADKAFLVNFAELQGRLDPLFYNTVHGFSLVKTTYPVKKLSEVINMQRGRFGHRPRNDPKFYDGQYPFIQTGDVVKASQTDSPIAYTQTLNELGLKTSRLFDKDVMVITIAANIGDTAILDYPACFPDSLIGITPKTTALTISYLNIYFKFLKPYLEDIAPQSAQKNINYQQLSPVPIVVPPLTIQKQITTLFKKSHKEKQQKEQQAQALLDSIDTYLLNELGITLPAEDRSLKNRILIARFSEVIGQRLDPYSRQDLFKTFKLPKSCFELQSIKQIASEIKTGLPIRKDFRVIGGIYPYYGANGIIGFMDEFTHDGKYLVIGQDGYIGNHYVVDGKFWGSNHNWVMKLKKGYDYDYIKYALDVLKYDYLITGAVIPKLTKQALESILIPMPKIIKQNEIAAHITQIRSQAKQLQTEAAQILNKAKAEIERMILGEI